MTSQRRTAGLSALIIAGGSGTRFWPASRASHPKPLFSVDGKRTLLAYTVLRLQPLASPSRIFVLAAASHAAAFRRALRGLIPPTNLIIEPAARGTAVAIAYGAAVIERRAGQGVIAVLPADHLIEPAAQFRATLSAAAGLAAGNQSIVVIGVPPSHPEPGFGYLKVGHARGRGFVVERFVEKPALAIARRMVRSGKYLWNAGMFVFSTNTLDAELRRIVPSLRRSVRRLVSMPAKGVARGYLRLAFDSFDREVVEKSKQVLGVRARFAWHDVGSWEGLRHAIGGQEGRILRGNIIALDSDRVVAHAGKRLMVLFGAHDIVAIDTDDAVLVAHRSRSQDRRRVSEELSRRGLHKYL
jgi:mannose-1-phosphate guanylyltransferase